MPDPGSFLALMGRLQAGDDAAASAVFQRFARRLIGLARSLLEARLRQKVDPEDVMLSVFKSFFLRYGEGQWQFGGWDDLWSRLALITVGKCHKWSDHFHTEGRDINREVANAASGSGIEGQVFAREPTPSEILQLTETVDELLRGLEGRDREIAALYLQRYTAPEISARLNRPLRTVYRLLERIKERLRRMQDGAAAAS